MSSVPPLSGDDASEPEILRPAPGYIPTPQPMVRRRRSFWATAPATYVLVGINVAVFILMLLKHVSGISPTPEQLMQWGANNAGSVLVNLVSWSPSLQVRSEWHWMQDLSAWCSA